MNDLERAMKLNTLVIELLNQSISIKQCAEQYDGATARWIEREMTEMQNRIKRYLNE